MRNIFSIFNSKKLPLAFLWAISIIIIIEVVFFRTMPPDLFNHEVDSALYDIEHKDYGADIVFLGDSLGGSILWVYDEQLATDNDKSGYVIIPGNQAIEMTGQYFLAKRYLARNKNPKAIIYMGFRPFGTNLNSLFTENYIKRCFLKPYEIIELMRYKGLGFGFIMLVYKLFPTYKYRLHIQNYLTGFANTDIYSGLLLKVNKIPRITKSKYSLNSLLPFLKYEKYASIADTHLKKLLDLLKQKSIRIYFVNPPVAESRFKKLTQWKWYNMLFNDYENWKSIYKNFYFSRELQIYPDEYFSHDKNHLTKKGRMRAAKEFREKLARIKKELF